MSIRRCSVLRCVVLAGQQRPIVAPVSASASVPLIAAAQCGPRGWAATALGRTRAGGAAAALPPSSSWISGPRRGVAASSPRVLSTAGQSVVAWVPPDGGGMSGGANAERLTGQPTEPGIDELPITSPLIEYGLNGGIDYGSWYGRALESLVAVADAGGTLNAWEGSFARLCRAAVSRDQGLAANIKNEGSEQRSSLRSQSPSQEEQKKEGEGGHSCAKLVESDPGQAAATWSTRALDLLARMPTEVIDHVHRIDMRATRSFNMVADCLLYLRAVHFSNWSSDLQGRFESSVQSQLHPRCWPEAQTPAAAAMLYLEFADSPKRRGRAIYSVRRHGIRLAGTQHEHDALLRQLLLQGRARSGGASKPELQDDRRRRDKEAVTRLLTSNVHVSHAWWNANFTRLYEATAAARAAKEGPRLVGDRTQSAQSLDPRPKTLLPRRSADWPSTALRILAHQPGQALRFLLQSDDVPRYPFHMISDCFLFLRAFFYDRADEAWKHAFRRAARQCLAPSRWLAVYPAETGVRLYLQVVSTTASAPAAELRRACDHILRHDIVLPLNVLLYLMSLFVKAKDSEYALVVLERVASRCSAEDLSSPSLREHCCLLLSLAESATTDGGRPAAWDPRIWQRMLELGITPDQAMLNIVLRAALKHHLHDAAWHALDLMREHGLTPDSYTYGALLEDAALTEDLEQLDLLIGEMGAHMLRQRHIASKLLRVYLSHLFSRQYSRAERSRLLSRIMEVYGNAHDFQPLVDLGLVRPGVRLAAGGRLAGGAGRDAANESDARPQPSSHALVIVISAFLKSMADTASIVETFNRFRQLVRDNHPAYCPLAETDYIYNAFLMSLPPTHHLVTASVEIIRQMSEPLPAGLTVPVAAGDAPAASAT
ncbi:hypothetical protein KEM52_001800, partial [Ascosphaera acerosa]